MKRLTVTLTYDVLTKILKSIILGLMATIEVTSAEYFSAVGQD